MDSTNLLQRKKRLQPWNELANLFVCIFGIFLIWIVSTSAELKEKLVKEVSNLREKREFKGRK